MTNPRTRRLRRRGTISVAGIRNLSDFTARWVALLWQAMQKTGKGYPRPKQTRESRREDKVGAINRKALRGVRGN